MSHRHHGAGAQTEAVVASTYEPDGGGDPPPPTQASVVPVTVTLNGFGATTIPAVRVNTADGRSVDGRSVEVDHQGGRHDGVEERAAENRLPPGGMACPAGPTC